MEEKAWRQDPEAGGYIVSTSRDRWMVLFNSCSFLFSPQPQPTEGCCVIQCGSSLMQLILFWGGLTEMHALGIASRGASENKPLEHTTELNMDMNIFPLSLRMLQCGHHRCPLPSVWDSRGHWCVASYLLCTPEITVMWKVTYCVHSWGHCHVESWLLCTPKVSIYMLPVKFSKLIDYPFL